MTSTATARQVDASGWPLLVVTPSRIGSDESIVGITEGLEAALDRGERFCALFDCTGKTCMELREVRHLGRFLGEHGERMDSLVAAMGIVVPSAMVRGALKVIFGMRAPGHPYALFERRRKARAYLERHVAELAMPAAVGQ